MVERISKRTFGFAPLREWRNWQTRQVEGLVVVIPCRFKSCFPHFLSTARESDEFNARAFLDTPGRRTVGSHRRIPAWKSAWKPAGAGGFGPRARGRTAQTDSHRHAAAWREAPAARGSVRVFFRPGARCDCWPSVSCPTPVSCPDCSSVLSGSGRWDSGGRGRDRLTGGCCFGSGWCKGPKHNGSDFGSAS